MSNYEKLDRIKTITKEINPNVVFNCETVSFGKDRFTNIYWLELKKDSLKFKLSYADKLLPLKDFEKNDSSVIAGINVGGFYLSDDNLTPPVQYYNLAVDEGHIKQLPSNTRSCIQTYNGNLTKSLVIAHGLMRIGQKDFSWSGLNEKQDSQLIVYGMFNLDITKNKFRNPSNARETVETSRFIKANNNEILLGIGTSGTNPSVQRISKNTLDLIQYSFILKGNKNLLKEISVGNEITRVRFGHVEHNASASLCSGSFILGKDKVDLDKNLRNELIHPVDGNPKPMSEEYKKSWSVILETNDSYILFINDARPKVPNQNGITVYELQDLILKKFDYTWGVVGDSGQSSKLFVRENGERTVYGNLHYINYSKTESYWDGINGRPVSVGLLAYA
ncbi:MAG TPA: hypothetical protein PLV59_02010 [Candidatus Dojkabacteria bacterium]|nr:hypothetical protein [Candidatus Dojkabacteria bacterium]